jgi:hypothetical protein
MIPLMKPMVVDMVVVCTEVEEDKVVEHEEHEEEEEKVDQVEKTEEEEID